MTTRDARTRAADGVSAAPPAGARLAGRDLADARLRAVGHVELTIVPLDERADRRRRPIWRRDLRQRDGHRTIDPTGAVAQRPELAAVEVGEQIDAVQRGNRRASVDTPTDDRAVVGEGAGARDPPVDRHDGRRVGRRPAEGLTGAGVWYGPL